MKKRLHFSFYTFLGCILLGLSFGCQDNKNNNQSSSISSDPTNNTATEMNQQSPPKEESTKESTSEDNPCSKLIPSALVLQQEPKAGKPSYTISNENVCLAQFEHKTVQKDSRLTLTAQKYQDLEQLQRVVYNFKISMPYEKEDINAGEDGVIVFDNTGKNHIYMVMFRLGEYGCSITAQHPGNADPGTGLLFTKAALTKLAEDWAAHMKQLLEKEK